MANIKLQRSLSQVKKEFSFRKPICPFISSTFQDFQEERDILVKKVFPRIDALCRERGTYCAPVDLRWGINDTQVSQGLVIQLCLDYIQKCSPFFICLLGERYGCCREEEAPPLPKTYKELPDDADWLDKNFMVAASAGYDWVLKPTYQNRSVTELEILQTAFIGNTDFCRFYFRQPDHVDEMFKYDPEDVRQERLQVYEMESEYKNLRVRDLKARIVKKGLPVKYFKSPQELADLVLEDWTNIVEQLYPQFEEILSTNYTERFAEWMAHETFAETRRRVFVRTPPLKALMADIDEFAYTSLDESPVSAQDTDGDQTFSFSQALRGKNKPLEAAYSSIMLLMGDRGCGKTSVLANWVKEFQEICPEVKIFSHYVGSSARSTDVTAFMRRCTLEMREEFPHVGGNKNDMTAGSEEMTDFHHVVEAFLAALALGPCIVVVDGVDELGETYGHSPQQVKAMSWLPFPLPPQCKMVMTTARSDLSYRNITQRPDCTTLRVPLITDKEAKRDIIEEYLAMHCKNLADEQIEKIVACRLSERPLFLAVLANELRVFGVRNRLDYHLESYLEATSVRELWARIIQRWIKDYSWTLDTALSDNNDSEELNGWVADALRLVAVSRHGLTQSEILDMLKQMGYDGEMEVTSLHWALFRSAAYDSLFERPGASIGFFHQHFKEAVEFTLLGSAIPSQIGNKPAVVSLTPMQMVEMSPRGRAPDRISFHKYIAEYFYWQPHCRRRTDELPWQLERGKNFTKLCEVLTEPKMFLALCGVKMNHVKKLELLQYWNVLQGAGFSPVDMYWKMLKLAGGESVHVAVNANESYPSMPKVTILAPDSDGLSSQLQLPNPRGVPRILTTSASSNNSSEDWPGNNNAQHLLESLTSSSHVSSRLESQVPPRSKKSQSQQSQQASLFSGGESRASRSVSLPGGSVSLPGGTERSEENDADSIQSSQDTFSDDGFTEESSGGMTQIEISRLANSTGQFLSVLGFYPDSEQMLISAHDRLCANFPLDLDEQHLLSGVQESIGNLFMFQARLADAEVWFNKALDSGNELLGYIIEAEEVCKLLEAKGRLLSVLGKMKVKKAEYKEAERMLLSAKRCMEKAGSVTGKAVVHLYIGVLRMMLGEYDKAEKYLRQALTCLERWYGRSHPKVSEVIQELATLLCDPNYKKRYDQKQAEILYRRALKIREQCFGDDHISVSETLYHLGKLLKTQKSQPVRSQALQYLRRALDIRTTKLGPNHHKTIETRRVMNDLEIVMKLKRTRPLDTRTDDNPYSTLSFHVDQLELLERKPRPRANSAKSRSVSEYTNSRCTDYKEIPKELASSYNGEEEEEEGEGEEDEVEGADFPASAAGDSCELETKQKLTLKSVSYSDQKTLRKFSNGGEGVEYSVRTQSATVTAHAQRAKIDVNFRPSTAPHRLHRYVGVAHGDEGRAPSEVHTTTRPSSATSAVEHRRRCYIPGPHTIDAENAYSAVRGPHAHIHTLLGPPEAPRYSAITRGIQHTSAWYHVRGRYQLPAKPFPPKRSQKRIAFKVNGRLRAGSRGLSRSYPDYRAVTPLAVMTGSVRG